MQVRDEISRGRGLRFMMYRNDHPPPHFHVEYQGVEALYIIESCTSANPLPPPQNKTVRSWCADHKVELLQNWHNAQNGLPMLKIAGP